MGNPFLIRGDACAAIWNHRCLVSSSLTQGNSTGVTYLLTFLRRVLFPVRDIMMRDIMEHVSDSTTRSHSIDRDLFISTVFGQNADKRVNCAFRPGIE